MFVGRFFVIVFVLCFTHFIVCDDDNKDNHQRTTTAAKTTTPPTDDNTKQHNDDKEHNQQTRTTVNKITFQTHTSLRSIPSSSYLHQGGCREVFKRGVAEISGEIMCLSVLALDNVGEEALDGIRQIGFVVGF